MAGQQTTTATPPELQSGAAEPFVGRDGFVMLALSCLVMIGSLGISFLVALSHVVRVGLTAQVTNDDAARVLVLGYRLTRRNYPAAAYRARLERALVLLRQAPDVHVFLLGGRPRSDQPSEASVGAAYLLQAGIGSQRIHQEDRSRHTLENLRHYRAAFPTTSSKSVALVSSRFHLGRATLMAGGLGLPVTPCGAESSCLATFRRPDCLIVDALMLHWYFVGRAISRWIGDRRVLARIS